MTINFIIHTYNFSISWIFSVRLWLRETARNFEPQKIFLPVASPIKILSSHKNVVSQSLNFLYKYNRIKSGQRGVNHTFEELLSLFLSFTKQLQFNNLKSIKFSISGMITRNFSHLFQAVVPQQHLVIKFFLRQSHIFCVKMMRKFHCKIK